MTNRITPPLLLLLVIISQPAVSLKAQQNCQPPAPQLSSARPNIFTEEQEVELGEAIAEQLQKNFRVIDDDAITSYLRGVGERIIRHLPQTRLRYQFFLVDLPEANAFVLPGGRIYVSRKLVAFVQSEDELAGVIAHEMGHLVARQGSTDMTRLMREVLKVTQVADRRDIFDKYNQLVDNSARNPKAFGRLGGHEDKDQVEADQIGLLAMAGAGYDPQAFSKFFDRLADTKGKTGGFFSNLFGVTSPDSKRLREMIRGVASLPAACIENRASVATEDFKRWQSAVVSYTGLGRKEALHAVVSKLLLDPPLRGDVTHLRFSPDGKYVLAQDDSGINVLTREPFAPVFRITAPEAGHAHFTPDSQAVVFHNSALRVETWGIAEEKLREAHELVVRKKCVQTELSPDGKTLACLDGDMTLNLFDVATGNQIFQKKSFYTPGFLDVFVRMLNAILNSDDSDDFEFDWVNMGFSPDGRYFAAGQRSTNYTAVGISSDNSAAVFDLQAKAPVKLNGTLKKFLAGGFAFMSPDRLIGLNVEDSRKSGILSFPAGDAVEQFDMYRGKFEAPTRGNYLLIRPAGKMAVGVMDVAKRQIFKGNRMAALDTYDQVFVAERLTGELGLYGVEKNDLRAVVQLPQSQLGRLRATTVSPDFKWLAVSEKNRGAAWDLTKGQRKLFVRGFRGGHVGDDGALVADFPKFEGTERKIARIDLNRPESASAVDVTEDRARQYGPYMLITKPAKKDGSNFEDVILELQDSGSLRTIWTKPFPKEAPRVWLDPREDSLVLSWPVSDKAAQSEIKSDPALKQKMGNKKEQEGDYYLQVYEARSGNLRGKLLVETGKGSFRIASVFAVNDWVVVSDNENRVQVYSLATGEKKGQVFGGRAAAGKATGLLCVENESGQLSLYDLQSMQKRDQFTFSNPVALARFSPDGKRLFVLTANQTAYVLNVASTAK